MTNTLFFDDFESGGAAWSTFQFTGTPQWEIGDSSFAIPPYSGINSAGTILAGNYQNNSDDALQSPYFNPSSPLNRFYVEFFLYVESEAGFDGMTLYVEDSSDPGNGLPYLENNALYDEPSMFGGPLVDLPAYSGGPYPSWQKRTVDLTVMGGAGRAIWFDFASDGTGRDKGVYLDNVQFYEVSAPSYSLPFADSFESDLGWVYHVSPYSNTLSHNPWQRGPPSTGPGAAFDGSGVYATILDDNYSNIGYELTASLISPTFDVSSHTNLHFSFHQYLDVEDPGGYDAANIKVSTNGGLTWLDTDGGLSFSDGNSTINPPYNGPISADYGNPSSNQRAWTTDRTPWEQVQVDLTAFDGAKSLNIRFDFNKDASLSDPGWYIDLFEFDGLALPIVATNSFNTKQYTSVQDAIDEIPDGHTIYINSSNVIFESLNISGKKDFRIIGDGQTLLDGSGAGVGLNISSSTNITIEGLIISNFARGVLLDSSSRSNQIVNNTIINVSGNGISVFNSFSTISNTVITGSASNAIYLSNSIGDQILSNHIFNNYNGILVEADSHSIIIKNNYIHNNNGDALSYGIHFFQNQTGLHTAEVINNEIHNHRDAVWVASSDRVYLGGNVLRENTVMGLKSTSSHFLTNVNNVFKYNGSAAIGATTASNSLFARNLIVSNDDGIQLNANVNSSYFINNTFVDQQEYGGFSFMGGATGTVTVANNVFSGNTGESLYDDGSSANVLLSYNLSSDGTFTTGSVFNDLGDNQHPVDVKLDGTANYELLSDSPAVDNMPVSTFNIPVVTSSALGDVDAGWIESPYAPLPDSISNIDSGNSYSDLAQAFSELNDGETLLLDNGSYTTNLDFTGLNNVRLLSREYYEYGGNNQNVILQGSGSGTGILLQNTSGIEIGGLVFSNFSNAIRVSSPANGNLVRENIFIQNHTGLLLENAVASGTNTENTFISNTWGAIVDNSHAELFTRNQFIDNQAGGLWLLNTSGTNQIIRNEFISHTNPLAKAAFFQGPLSGQNQVINNRFESNRQSIHWLASQGFNNAFEQNSVNHNNGDVAVKIEGVGEVSETRFGTINLEENQNGGLLITNSQNLLLDSQFVLNLNAGTGIDVIDSDSITILRAGILFSPEALRFRGTAAGTHRVFNSVMDQNTSAIHLENASVSLEVANNILINNGTALQQSSGTLNYGNNNFYNNSSDFSGSLNDLGNNLFADPQLHPISYEPQTNSQVIDAGLVLAPYVTNYFGLAPDMGVFEYDPSDKATNLSQQKGYYTLQQAVDAAETGDILLAFSGEIVDPLSIDAKTNVSVYAADFFVNGVVGSTRLRGMNTTALTINDSKNINISGFRIQDASNGLAITGHSDGSTIYANEMNYNAEDGLHIETVSNKASLIYSNVIRGNGKNGIRMLGADNRNYVFVNNNIENNQSIGLGIRGSDHFITNNYISRNGTNLRINGANSTRNAFIGNTIRETELGLEIVAGDSNTIENNLFENYYDSAIRFRNASVENDIRGNVFNNDQGFAIFLDGVNNAQTIRENSFQGNHSVAIYISNATSHVILNNYIRNASSSVLLDTMASAFLAHNTIRESDSSSVFIQNTASASLINNIIMDSGSGFGAEVMAGGLATISNNILFQNASGPIGGAGTIIAGDNILTSPDIHFNDGSINNGSSPAVDAGLILAGVNTVFFGTAPDIGYKESSFGANPVARIEETGISYAPIQAAVDAAITGQTILVYPGSYNELVRFDSSDNLSLIAVDFQLNKNKRSTVIENSGAAVVEVDGVEGTLIKGFSFGSSLNGVRIFNGAISNTVANNYFYSNQTGVYALNSGALSLVGNDFNGSDMNYGLQVDNSQDIEIEKNIFSNYGQVAIHASNQSSINFLNENTLKFNSAAISLNSMTNIELSDNVIAFNVSGVGLKSLAFSVLKENEFISNGNPSLFLSGASFSNSITRNTFVENTGDVLSFVENGADFPSSNYIAQNSFEGGGSGVAVYISDGKYNQIFYNDIEQSTIGVLLISDSVSNTVQGNSIYNQSDSGIYLNSGQVLYNTVSDNTIGWSDRGVRLTASDYNLIHNNTVFSNTRSGLFLAGESIQNALVRNASFGNNEAGLEINSDLADQNTVISNTFYNNGTYGLYLNDADETQVHHNVIAYNSGIGVFFEGNAWDSLFFHNTVANNGNHGLRANGSSTVHWTNNIIHQNSGSAIDSGSSPTFSGDYNLVHGNGSGLTGSGTFNNGPNFYTNNPFLNSSSAPAFLPIYGSSEIVDTALPISGINDIYLGNAPDLGWVESSYSDYPDQLVLHLPLDGNATDSSGNGLDGTADTGVSGSADRYGNANSAMFFDQSAQARIEIGHNDLLNLYDEYSMSAWFRTEDPTNVQFIFGKAAGQYELHLNDIMGFETNSIRAIPNDEPYLDSPQGLFETNFWNHVLVNWESGVGGELWLNGELISSLLTTSNLNGSDEPFYIGIRGNQTLPFKGAIDDVRIYNYTLPPVDVSNLAAREKFSLSVTGNPVFKNEILSNVSAYVGYTNNGVFTISNVGFVSNLNIDDVYFSDTSNFSILTSAAGASLAEGDSTNFTLAFTPQTVGTFTNTIIISNSDFMQNAFQFQIEGIAIDAFITTWDVPPGSFTFPGMGGPYKIDWGDGSVSNNVSGNVSHLYTAGTYNIAVSGDIDRFNLNNINPIRNYLVDIKNWGDIQWTSMENAFYGAANLSNYSATDTPILSNVTSLNGLFRNATTFNGEINNWDVETVSTLEYTFSGAQAFNRPLSNWQVSNVTSMRFTFSSASDFNQNINNWDTTSLLNMRGIFQSASSFNQPLSNWSTSNVIDMHSAFFAASDFNQNINSWDVGNVTQFDNMFRVGSFFNQPLSNWTPTNATSLNGMFRQASSFNQTLQNWDTSSVLNMSSVFLLASDFDQNLGSWDIASVTSMNSMLNGSGLSQTNYEATLNGWAAQSVQPSVTLAASGRTYGTNAYWARDRLTSVPNNWDIQNDSFIYSGLVADYSLDNTAEDRGFFSNHGAISNALAVSNRYGLADTALSFGLANQRIDLDSKSSQFDFDSPASFSFWAKPNFDNRSSGGILFQINDGESGNDNSEFAIGYGQFHSGLVDEWLTVFVKTNGPLLGSASISAVVTDQNHQDQWNHFVVTADGSTWQVWIDGQLKTTVNGTNGTGNINLGDFGEALEPFANMSLGQRYSLSGGGSTTFNGVLDEFKIYNSLLAPTDISNLAAHPRLSLNFDGIAITNGSILSGITTNVGRSNAGVFSLSNIGIFSNLTIADLSISDNTHFSILTNPSTWDIAAGEGSNFSLAFTPQSAGTFTNTLTVSNSDFNQSVLSFQLIATAVPNIQAMVSNIDQNLEYASIQAALNAASDNDTIRVYSGVHNEQITNKTGLTGITLESLPWAISGDASSTIIRTDNTNNSEIFRLTAITNWTIRGFSFVLNSNAIVLADKNKDNTIISNLFVSNISPIIISGAASSNNTLAFNNFNTFTKQAIYIDYGSGNHVLNNQFFNGAAQAIHLNYADANLLIGNNISNVGVGIDIANSERVSISNNTIAYALNEEGILLRSASSENLISSNSIIQSLVGIREYLSDGTNRIEANYIENGNLSLDVWQSAHSHYVSNNIENSAPIRVLAANSNRFLANKVNNNNGQHVFDLRGDFNEIENNIFSNSIGLGLYIASNNNDILFNEIFSGAGLTTNIQFFGSANLNSVLSNNFMGSNSIAYLAGNAIQENFWNTINAEHLILASPSLTGTNEIAPYRLGKIDIFGSDREAPAVPALNPITRLLGALQLTWAPVVGVAGYKVYRATNGTWTNIDSAYVEPGNVLTWTDSSVSAGVDYSYFLTMYDATSPLSNESFFSLGQTARLPNLPQIALTNFVDLDVLKGTVTLKGWYSNDGELSTKLYLSNSLGKHEIDGTLGAWSTNVDTSLFSDGTNEFSFSASNQFGETFYIWTNRIFNNAVPSFSLQTPTANSFVYSNQYRVLVDITDPSGELTGLWVSSNNGASTNNLSLTQQVDLSLDVSGNDEFTNIFVLIASNVASEVAVFTLTNYVDKSPPEVSFAENYNAAFFNETTNILINVSNDFAPLNEVGLQVSDGTSILANYAIASFGLNQSVSLDSTLFTNGIYSLRLYSTTPADVSNIVVATLIEFSNVGAIMTIDSPIASSIHSGDLVIEGRFVGNKLGHVAFYSNESTAGFLPLTSSDYDNTQWTNRIDTSLLANGLQTFAYYFTNVSGSNSITNALELLIDNSLPVLSFSGLTNDRWVTNTNRALSMSASALSGIDELAWRFGADSFHLATNFSNYVTNVDLSSLANSREVFELRAISFAGNTNRLFISNDYDFTAPTLSFVSNIGNADLSWRGLLEVEHYDSYAPLTQLRVHWLTNGVSEQIWELSTSSSNSTTNYRAIDFSQTVFNILLEVSNAAGYYRQVSLSNISNFYQLPQWVITNHTPLDTLSGTAGFQGYFSEGDFTVDSAQFSNRSSGGWQNFVLSSTNFNSSFNSLFYQDGLTTFYFTYSNNYGEVFGKTNIDFYVDNVFPELIWSLPLADTYWTNNSVPYTLQASNAGAPLDSLSINIEGNLEYQSNNLNTHDFILITNLMPGLVDRSQFISRVIITNQAGRSIERLRTNVFEYTAPEQTYVNLLLSQVLSNQIELSFSNNSFSPLIAWTAEVRESGNDLLEFSLSSIGNEKTNSFGLDTFTLTNGPYELYLILSNEAGWTVSSNRSFFVSNDYIPEATSIGVQLSNTFTAGEPGLVHFQVFDQRSNRYKMPFTLSNFTAGGLSNSLSGFRPSLAGVDFGQSRSMAFTNGFSSNVELLAYRAESNVHLNLLPISPLSMADFSNSSFSVFSAQAAASNSYFSLAGNDWNINSRLSFHLEILDAYYNKVNDNSGFVQMQISNTSLNRDLGDSTIVYAASNVYTNDLSLNLMGDYEFRVRYNFDTVLRDNVQTEDGVIPVALFQLSSSNLQALLKNNLLENGPVPDKNPVYPGEQLNFYYRSSPGKSLKIKLFDLSGKKVQTLLEIPKVYNSSIQSFTYDLSDENEQALKPGVYTIALYEDEEYQRHFKLIILPLE